MAMGRKTIKAQMKQVLNGYRARRTTGFSRGIPIGLLFKKTTFKVIACDNLSRNWFYLRLFRLEGRLSCLAIGSLKLVERQ